MWFLYVPVIMLVMLAAGSAFMGAFVIAIPAVLLAGALALAPLLLRARDLRLTAVDRPSELPSSREAAYDPRQDPGATATGSSTGTA